MHDVHAYGDSFDNDGPCRNWLKLTGNPVINSAARAYAEARIKSLRAEQPLCQRTRKRLKRVYFLIQLAQFRRALFLFALDLFGALTRPRRRIVSRNHVQLSLSCGGQPRPAS